MSQADIAALDSFAVANGLPLPAIGAVPELVMGTMATMTGAAVMMRRRRRCNKWVEQITPTATRSRLIAWGSEQCYNIFCVLRIREGDKSWGRKIPGVARQ
jgi:hypothetical protein